jgi:hypothetical protein
VKLSIALALQAEHQIQIDFRRILHRKERTEHPIGCRLYSYLSKLGKTFVTTNYDERLDEDIEPPTTDIGGAAGRGADVALRARTVYFKPEDVTAANLNRQDVVIHLHGSVNVIEMHDPSAASRKPYGSGPASVPPAEAGSSPINRWRPTTISCENSAALPRTVTVSASIIPFPSTHGPFLLNPEALSQKSLHDLAGSVLRQVAVGEFNDARNLVVGERAAPEGDQFIGADRLA